MQHYLFIKLLTIETTGLYQRELTGTICSYQDGFYFTILPVDPSDRECYTLFKIQNFFSRNFTPKQGENRE